MELKRILWSLLAGLSFSVAGCNDVNEPVAYGPPPQDTQVDQETDSSDSQDQDQVEVSDIVSEDPAQEDGGPAPMYGPVVDT